MDLVIPDFDFIVISARYNKRLVKMKVYTTNWPIVFFESFNDCSYSVIPTFKREREKER